MLSSDVLASVSMETTLTAASIRTAGRATDEVGFAEGEEATGDL